MKLISLAWIALLFFTGAANAQDIYLALEATGRGTYTIEGRFWTPGDPLLSWNVLTDYDHLPNFIPSLLTSHVQERTAKSLLLQQEAIGKALLVFHRRLHVLLKVTEQPYQQITFEDVSHQDFRAYSGSWKIERADGGGSWVTYDLQATPNFFAPAPIARTSFRKNARDLLLSIQSEIVRRGNLDRTLLCCSQIKN
jgi:hypothetical protein